MILLFIFQKLRICILFAFIQVAVCLDESKPKINLEDIERDNLISEQRSQNTDIFESQQTQHLRPPSIQATHSSYDVYLI